MMRNAAEIISRMGDWLARGVVTPKEFGMQAIDAMLNDEACDPAALLRDLPEQSQAIILCQVCEYTEKDYFVEVFCLGRGDTPQDVIERQPRLRKLCLDLLNANRLSK
jgi:hypothetical protein